MKKIQNRFAKVLANPVNVVGCVAGRLDYVRAGLLPIFPHPNYNLLQVIEIRLDKMPLRYLRTDMINRFPRGMPLIITVRDKSEGGGRKKWTIAKRKSLYRKFLPFATFIDIEAKLAHLFEDVIAEAKELGVGIILSAHYFKDTPNNEELFRLGNVCYKVGGDVLKMVTKVSNRRDILELHHAALRLENVYDFRVATMSVGEPFGEILRYLDILCGGPFIYGRLSEEVSVPGQPHALQVRRNFAKFGIELD